MAVAFVQHLGSIAYGSASTTTVLSLSKAVTAGDRIVVGVDWLGTAGTPSCVDNLGNVYTLDASGGVAGTYNAHLFSAPVTVAGTLTSITVTHPSAIYRGLSAAEFAGVGTLSASGGASGSAVAQTSGNWTNGVTIPASGLAVGIMFTNNIATTHATGPASGSPSTASVMDDWRGDAANVSSSLHHAIAGAVNVTGFSGSATFASDTWAAVGAVYNPVVEPPPVTVAPPGPVRFPTLRTFVDWAGLVDAPDYLSWVSTLTGPIISVPTSSLPYTYGVPLYDPAGSATVDEMGSLGATLTPTRVTLGRPSLNARGDDTCAGFVGTGYVSGSISIAIGTIAMLVRAKGFVDGYLLAGPAGCLGLRATTSGYLVLSMVGTGDICTATSPLVLDRAHHIAAMYDGTTARLYLDGADVSGATTVRATSGSGTAYIGALNATTGGWIGDIADVFLWSGIRVAGKDIAYLASLCRDPFAETNAEVTAWTTEAMDVTRGRSTDQGADATGQATFTLLNHDDRFTPDRNWATNGSIETDLQGWSTDSGIHVGPGAADLRRVVDNAGLGGYYAGECDLSVLPGAGLAYDVPQRVSMGQAYTATVALKSMSGATALRIGLGSVDDAGDATTADVTLTGSWQVFTVAWTPDTYYGSFRFFIRGQNPAAATFRVDALSIGPGTTATFIEAPTKDQLTPGRAVLVTAGFEPVSSALFFGRLDKLSPDPVTKTVAVQAYDQFAELNRKTVPFHTVTGSHREMRADVLRRAFAGQRNEERGRLATTFYAASVGQTQLASRSMQELPSGEFITFSGEVRGLTPGSSSLTLRLAYGTKTQDRTIAVTGRWSPFQHTMEAGGYDVFSYGVVSTVAYGIFELRNLVVTTSPARLPFTPYGDGLLRSYRHNAALNNPSMEAWTRYWNTGFVNKCSNPSFESNTTGWSVAADAFHAGAGTSITRTAGGYDGSWCGRVVVPSAGAGAHFDFTGITFGSGKPYLLYVWARAVGSASNIICSILSNGTPSDNATSGIVALNTSTWTRIPLAWTPSADRTDVHFSFYVSSGALTVDVDALIVYWAPAPDAYQFDGANPLLLDSGSTESTFVLDETDGAVGTRCLRIASGNAVCYPFQQVGSWTTAPEGVQSFEPGCWYTASVYVKTGAVGSTITLSFGRQSKPAQAASETYVTRTTGWERVAVRWRPQAVSGAATEVFTDVFVVIRSSTGAGTKVDALLVSESRRLWPYEGRWAADLDPAESAWKVISQRLTGTVLGALNSLNAINQTVHRIDPVPAFPWWRYVTRTRGRLPAKQVAETFDDDLTGATGWDTSYDTIRNVARVETGTQWIDTTTNTAQTNPNSGTWTYSDPVSALEYGRVDASTLGGNLLENKPNDPTLQESLAADVIARYGQPRSRPTIFTENRWPSQLVRNPDDLVRVTFPRAGKYGALYLITTMALHIEQGGRLWRAGYTLEEHAFAPDETGVLAGGMPEYTGPEATLAVGMPQ